MERTTPTRRHSANRGFTLTELMIAMAIFLVLMTGLATMFNAAVTSARQGYASIDAFENARSAMTTIDRDLSGAFASDEFGDVYSFYGRPDGFMFVGALDGGVLGRVTYVFRPELSKPGFETTMREQWGVVESNVRRQFQRIARENGNYGANAFADVQAAVNALDTAYGGPYPVTQVVEFTVRIETESLIRVEEPGLSDLDAFNMYVKRDPLLTVSLADDTILNWPYVDATDPTLDAVVGALDANGAPQFNFLLSVLNPDPLTTTYDLRNMYATINTGGWTHPVTGDQVYLRVLGPQTFDTLLRTKKREFWIRMLSGEFMGLQDLDPSLSDDGLGYWYDEAYAQAFGLLDGRDHSIVNEYVVSDGIIGRAVLIDPATGLDVNYLGDALDALDAGVKFSYGDGKNGSVNYFNAMENLRNPDDPYEPYNLPFLLSTGAAGFSNADLVFVDGQLADNLLNVNATRNNLGSPLLPRLPTIVTPELWVTRSRTRPGAPDFRRRFVQGIQVPAATGRTPSTIIARSPGQAG